VGFQETAYRNILLAVVYTSCKIIPRKGTFSVTGTRSNKRGNSSFLNSEGRRGTVRNMGQTVA